MIRKNRICGAFKLQSVSTPGGCLIPSVLRGIWSVELLGA